MAILEDEGLVERATAVGERLGAGLSALAADGTIAEARGVGAVWAAGLAPAHDAVEVRDRMAERGVITRAIGTDTVTFCPPLVVTDQQISHYLFFVEGEGNGGVTPNRPVVISRPK